MAGFGAMGGGTGAQGLALLDQIRKMQAPGDPNATPADPAISGAPNFVNNGLIGRMMSGNPGGLIGAIMKQQNAPVNPGAPPPAGSAAYPPGVGAQGPMPPAPAVGGPAAGAVAGGAAGAGGAPGGSFMDGLQGFLKSGGGFGMLANLIRNQGGQ